jgi:hypothetical protein
MRLHLNPYPLSLFTITKSAAGKTQLVAEHSDFGLGFRLHCLYTDAIDVGLVVKSDKTGQEVAYYLNQTKENNGEVLSWHLLPTPESARKVSGASNTEVIIFND